MTGLIIQLIQARNLFLQPKLPVIQPPPKNQRTDLRHKIPIRIISRLKLLQTRKLDFIQGAVPVGHDGK